MTTTMPRPKAQARSKATKARSRKAPATRAPSGGAVYVGLLIVLVALNLIGLIMVLSASSVSALHEYGSSWYYFKRDLVWLALGTAVLLVTMRVDYRRWRAIAAPAAVGSLGLLVLVLIPGLGVNVNGSTRWLGVGFFQVQPAEFAKLGLLLFAADLLARRQQWIDDTRLTLRPVLAVFAVAALLLMAQPNLGTTLVLAAIVFSVLFTSGIRLLPLTGYGLIGVFGAMVLSLGEGYRRARVLAFLDPWSDKLNTGYQTIQSQVSLASGGLFGVGLGASRAKWGFLPYAHTDFIYAIIGEELGLLGATLVVVLFLMLGFLGVRTAVHAADPFGRLLAAGITTWICVQAFVNIGAVVGVLPITGVPLPFISFGGSSLLATMAASGVLLNVARHANWQAVARQSAPRTRARSG